MMRNAVAALPIQSVLLALVLTIVQTDLSATEDSIEPLRSIQVVEAHQAVAVDASSFYAISNRTIGRYDKESAKCLVRWEAPAKSGIEHLNSGVVIEGKLYCANSNWPSKPLKNTVEIFEAETLKHVESKPFSETEGAINWIDRHQDAWWIAYAFYGDAEVRRTKLVRCDSDWKVTGQWTFPESVIQRFLPNSNSGGAFGPNGKLYVTGHDHAEVYVLDVPADGGELDHVATLPAPIAGQGIVWDDDDPGVLIGIVRGRREVVFMRFTQLSQRGLAAQPLTVVADFEGASVRDVEIDELKRTISFKPGGDPERGRPCWWYFRVDGIGPDEEITLRLRGSDATIGTEKPLAPSWAMPAQATYSVDGDSWLHTDAGERQGESITRTP